MQQKDSLADGYGHPNAVLKNVQCRTPIDSASEKAARFCSVGVLTGRKNGWSAPLRKSRSSPPPPPPSPPPPAIRVLLIVFHLMLTRVKCANTL